MTQKYLDLFSKNVLNISEFFLAGGTYVEQTFTPCLIGVCTPLESLWNYVLFRHINKKITYSDIYSWERVLILKDREMFSLEVTKVAPAGECATFSIVLKTVLCFTIACCCIQCTPYVDLQLNVFLSPLPDSPMLRYVLNNRMSTSLWNWSHGNKIV